MDILVILILPIHEPGMCFHLTMMDFYMNQVYVIFVRYYVQVISLTSLVSAFVLHCQSFCICRWVWRKMYPLLCGTIWSICQHQDVISKHFYGLLSSVSLNSYAQGLCLKYLVIRISGGGGEASAFLTDFPNYSEATRV